MITLHKINDTTGELENDVIFIEKGNLTIEIIPWNKITSRSKKDLQKVYKKITINVSATPENLYTYSKIINKNVILNITDDNTELVTTGLVFKKLYFSANILDKEDIAVNYINISGYFIDFELNKK